MLSLPMRGNELSKKLRHNFMGIQGNPLWNIASVKTAPEWLEIMRLADSIRTSIESKNNAY